MSVRFVTVTPLTLTANTTMSVGASTVVCSTILLQADSANVGTCYWGASGVATNTGITLVPGEKAAITYDLTWGNSTKLTLDAIRLNAATTNDKVRVSYWQVD